MPTSTPTEVVNGMNEHPLGMTRGSVRALIAMAVIAVFLGLVVFCVVTEVDTMSPVMTVLGTIVATVIAWYFAKRDQEGQEDSARVREWLVGELTRMRLDDDENGGT